MGRRAKRASVSYNEFFRHLRAIPHHADLLQFLRSIDPRAAVEIARLIVQYLTPWEDQASMSEREQRGKNAQRELRLSINLLRKTAIHYGGLEKFLMEGGFLVRAGQPFWPEGYPALSDVLAREADRLKDVLTKCKPIFTYKRLGVTGYHLYLVFLQEFVRAWSHQELGYIRELRIEEIAALLRAGRLALGWKPERAEVDPELVGKAIGNFRRGARNALLVGEAITPLQAKQHCQRVRNSPLLIGIEI